MRTILTWWRHRRLTDVPHPCSGVGFGICHRLLIHLSQTIPPDAQPQFKSLHPGKAETPLDTDAAPTETYDGLTLVMACRSQKRAMKARAQLLKILDAHVEKERRRPGYDGHAERFRENVQVAFHHVDMTDTKSVFEFCDEISRTYVLYS